MSKDQDHENMTERKISGLQVDAKVHEKKESVRGESCGEGDPHCHGTGPHSLEHHPKEPGTSGQSTGPHSLEHHPRESVTDSTGRPPNDRGSNITGPRPNERTSE